MYYWVVDYKADKQGQLHPVIFGGRAFTSELLAQRFIDESNLSPRAEIFPLPTSNQSSATGQVKAKLVKRYGSKGEGWEKGLERAVHKV